MEPVPVDEGDAGVPGASATYALEGDGAWIARARGLAAAFLARAAEAADGLAVSARAVEVTQLVVSELVTNARKYAPGPVRLDLSISGSALEVGVRDGNPVLPVARGADPGRVGQHGLEIVMALAEALEIRQEAAGKRVTARISLVDAPGDR
ncbi:ATP-binding protein [Streptomyces sp. H28]|uniref:ATP-binding protein n=1 Tax=Streptomyces sp. H28 TaxID=2775865 RepID=UPI00177F1D0A|nr:ATP-binding protein [Streptomyces sp. H28]MBD9735101.1 ATP-binding protein [Streptomyces sp. H28]